MLRRITELYCFAVPMVLGYDGTHDIVEYFFRLHFYNFQADLTECLENVRKTWTEKDMEEFPSDIKQNGAPFYRIPRGFNAYNNKELGELNNSKASGKPEEGKK